MLIKEMHIGVNLRVQKIDSNFMDDLLPEEVDYYINDAIESYIKQQYSYLKGEISIETQYISENLRTLITTKELNNPSLVDYLTNAVQFEYPEEKPFYYYLTAKVKNNNVFHNTQMISDKQLRDYNTTEYNMPLFRYIPILFTQNNIIVTADRRTNLDEQTLLNLTYIRKPNRVSLEDEINCDLPEHTHKEIVKIAANDILNDIQGT